MDSIHPQKRRTHIVMDWPEPENSNDIRGFPVVTSYYRTFIAHYTHIAMQFNTIGTTVHGKGDVGR